MGVHSAKALRRTSRMTRRPKVSAAPKKSETLEIRLPHQTKTDFMARCQTEGRTASEAVRRFIEGELTEDAPRRMRPGFWPARWPALGQALAAAVAGLAIGAVAAPSLAQTSPGPDRLMRKSARGPTPAPPSTASTATTTASSATWNFGGDSIPDTAFRHQGSRS
jgi:hypothetical protein